MQKNNVKINQIRNRSVVAGIPTQERWNEEEEFLRVPLCFSVYVVK